MTSHLHLLIAEDDENDVFLMNRALRHITEPPVAHFVEDGKALMDYLAGVGEFADRFTHPLPDFVITDLKMPRKTGFEALQWIRAQPEFKNLPVLVLSASCEGRDLFRAEELLASAYFVKPSNIGLLTQELIRFFDVCGPTMAV